MCFYHPGECSRYCKVEAPASAKIDEDSNKTASSILKIKTEIGLPGIIKAKIDFVFEKIKWGLSKDSNKDYSVSTNTGICSAATNTGRDSETTNTGDCSVATNTGDGSAAIVEGRNSIAIVSGRNSKAKGALGCWLVLTDRDENLKIKEVRAIMVDGVEIKADTFYQLIDGNIIEAK